MISKNSKHANALETAKIAFILTFVTCCVFVPVILVVDRSLQAILVGLSFIVAFPAIVSAGVYFYAWMGYKKN